MSGEVDTSTPLSVGAIRARFEEQQVLSDGCPPSTSSLASSPRLPAKALRVAFSESRLRVNTAGQENFSQLPIPCLPISPRLPPVPDRSLKPPSPLNVGGTSPSSNGSSIADRLLSPGRSPDSNRREMPAVVVTKPPIAPKPKFLLPDYKPSVKHRESSVRSQENILNNNHSEEENRTKETVDTTPDRQEPTTATVKERVKALHQMILQEALRENPHVADERAISLFSMTSTNDDETVSDDALSSSGEGSDDETATIATVSPKTSVSERSEGNTSRLSSTSYSARIHDMIMSELKRKDIVRGSSHTGRPKSAEKNHDQSEEIPSDVGKLRPATDKRREIVSPPVSTLSDSSGSTRSSGFVDQIAENEDNVRDYQTGDEEEDKRLKKLHFAALEFLTVQKAFVKYLDDIIRVFPEYLMEFGKQTGKPIITTPRPMPGQVPNSVEHVVHQLYRLLSNYYTFHQGILLRDIEQCLKNWDSANPIMSSVFLISVEFLKECVPFLKEKGKLAEEMTRLLKENHDFATATLSFETNVFRRGVGAVVQQLDQVHQNFMRYKILMLRYAEYLPDGCEEKQKAQAVIEKLEKISQSVNVAMGLPTSDQLLRLYDKFQGQFDVFAVGRRLIREEEVRKQTRKDQQIRVLVLFSDTLWICRYAGALGSSSMFDVSRSYPLAVEGIRCTASKQIDLENYLELRSKEKSVGIFFKSKAVRDEWEQLIASTRKERLNLKKRLSMARESENRNSKDIPSSMDGLRGASRPTSLAMPPYAEECSSSRPESPSDEQTNGCVTPEDTLATPTGDGGGGAGLYRKKSKVRVKDAELPVWISDKFSSKCLMENCENEFKFYKRRHHCRNCGWLICKECSGVAPVARLNYQKSIVCPECYNELLQRYKEGELFPLRVLVEQQGGSYLLRTKKRNGKEVLINPGTMFSEPIHVGYKRMSQLEERIRGGHAVFSKVYLRTKKGEQEMHALLEQNQVLKFFRAKLDSKPYVQQVLLGYELREREAENDEGTVFELVHLNQFNTNRQNENLTFRVVNDKSAKMWSQALNDCLKELASER